MRPTTTAWIGIFGFWDSSLTRRICRTGRHGCGPFWPKSSMATLAQLACWPQRWPLVWHTSPRAHKASAAIPSLSRWTCGDTGCGPPCGRSCRTTGRMAQRSGGSAARGRPWSLPWKGPPVAQRCVLLSLKDVFPVFLKICHICLRNRKAGPFVP